MPQSSDEVVRQYRDHLQKQVSECAKRAAKKILAKMKIGLDEPVLRHAGGKRQQNQRESGRGGGDRTAPNVEPTDFSQSGKLTIRKNRSKLCTEVHGRYTESLREVCPMIPADYFDHPDTPTKNSPVGKLMRKIHAGFPHLELETIRKGSRASLHGVGGKNRIATAFSRALRSRKVDKAPRRVRSNAEG
jgi:hypothetical protein